MPTTGECVTPTITASSSFELTPVSCSNLLHAKPLSIGMSWTGASQPSGQKWYAAHLEDVNADVLLVFLARALGIAARQLCRSFAQHRRAARRRLRRLCRRAGCKVAQLLG